MTILLFSLLVTEFCFSMIDKTEIRMIVILFKLDSFDDDECCSRSKSDLFSYDNTPIDRINTSSTVKSINKKMSDITDLIDSTELNNKEESLELISQNVSDCLRTHGLKTDQNNYEKPKWETEEQYLKHGNNKASAFIID